MYLQVGLYHFCPEAILRPMNNFGPLENFKFKGVGLKYTTETFVVFGNRVVGFQIIYSVFNLNKTGPLT